MKIQISKYSRNLMLLGTVYFISVFVIGANCDGLECLALGWGIILFFGSLPWSYIAEFLPTITPKPPGSSILHNPFLYPSSWPGLIVIYLSFMVNMWLLGIAIEWLVNRKKNKS